ncbi:MAG: ACP S-malonyltransferase [Anaerolineales bacterium]|nr:ACP S-malonyltransferase [Anaerolineales bacterium]
MAQALVAQHAVARDTFDRADRVLGRLLSRLCFEGPAEALNDTANTQPAVFVASVAALRVLQQQDDRQPAYVAGHSVGEFSALVGAGALSFEDGLALVRERSRLMKQAGECKPGGMAAILGLSREAVEEVCQEARDRTREYVGVANDNCPGQQVISGASAALQQAIAVAKERGAKRVVPLAVSVAAHSPLMDEAAQTFRGLMDATPFSVPAVPCVSNATACAVADGALLREALGQQLTSPVRWSESVRWMISQGVTHFIEVGPGDVLTGLNRRIDRAVESNNTDTMLAQ